MKLRHLSKHLKSWLCLSALLLNSFNSVALAQKPQTRFQKTANDNLLRQAIASSPLSFEANHGQAPVQTQFLARKNQFAISLSSTEASVSMGNKNLNLHFIGSNNQAQAIGEELLNEKTNYLIGNNPKDFRTNIPHYARARFKEVYSGVDVVYYGDGGRLKYDIIVAPGSDPNIVKIRYDGIEKLKIDRDGNLVLNMTGGMIVQPKPLIYQSIDNERRYVTGKYVIRSKNQIGFRLGEYDKSIPLVIDPVLIFATYLGGSASEEGVGVATDFEGNTYIVGTTSSLNFPITQGAFQTAGAGKDVFVTKLNPNGTSVVYSTYIGGSLDDSGYGITIDSDGNAYITGTTVSANYPITTGVLQTTSGGSTDAFVTKLNVTGSALVYSTYLGGASNEEGFGIALDFTGDVYVTGVTASTNFKVTSGTMQTSLAGATDAFVTKLNRLGSEAIFSTYAGGGSADIGFGIALERATNSPIITGITDSMNFPATAGAFRTVSSGSSDAFVVKLNSSGSAASFATFLGGSGIDAGVGIAVDSTGNAYVNGLTDSLNFPTTAGSLQPANAGGESDAFVTKLNAAGSALVYSTYIGGNGGDTSAGIALDFSEKAILSGTTSSANFPVTGDAIQAVFGGGRDAFISRLNHSGSGQVYSSFIGGTQGEEAFGVAIDVGANTYVTGATSSPNFPTTAGAFMTTGAGGSDGFLVKVGPGADSPMLLLMETSGPAVHQALGLESVLMFRDPFPLIGTVSALSLNGNTRVTIFLANLQLLPGENASAVVINLVDSSNQSFDVAADAVRQVPNFPFTQVSFKLPDTLSVGTCVIKVKAHSQISNAGTIRIRN